MDKKGEVNKIDSMLPSVWNEGLLTDIECRKIASTTGPLDEKKAVAHEIIMSKKYPAALELIGKFEVLSAENYKGLLSENQHHLNNECNGGTDSECNCDFNSQCDSDSDSDCDCETDCKCEEKKNDPNSVFSAQRNPFLQRVVIECLFEYLTLKENKNARLVCRIWNSTSELILRKKGAVYFCPNVFRPADFLASSKYSLLEVPFSSFKFIEYNDFYEEEEDQKSFLVSEPQNFFDEWGKNIKELFFMYILLANGRKLNRYDVTPWFVKLPNITNLKIEVAREDYARLRDLKQTVLEISLAPLASIKTMYLEECTILTKTNDEITQISASNISLINVSLKRDGKVVDDYSYNDLVDFSQASNCLVTSTNCCEYLDDVHVDSTAIIDMGRHVFKADQLCLLEIEVRNWKQAKGNVNYLHLKACPFLDQCQLKFKQLNFEYSKIDLSVIPNTIEKIRLSTEEILCPKAIHLENLNYLYFDVYRHNSKYLMHFVNCANFIELDLASTATLGRSNNNVIHLEYIPRSVLKCKIGGFRFKFSSHDRVRELDTLILEECPEIPLLSKCRFILTKIKPRNLVLVYSGEKEVDTSEIMNFVVSNEQLDNVVVGSNSEDWDLHKKIQYEGSLLSHCVAKKSNFYLFENQIGRAITQTEFKQWTKMNELDKDFCE